MNKYFIVLSLFLASCASTQRITWKTGVTEATIKLPEGAQKLTILDRVQIQYPFNNTNSTILNPNISEMHNGAINGLRSSILRQGFLSVFASASEFRQRANGTFPAQLTASEVTQVAIGSDVLVSLEMLDQYITDKYTVEIRRVNLGNNVYREVDFYVGHRTIDMKLGWRLYNSKTGALLDEWQQEEQYFYEAESRERLRATNLLNANYRTELTNLGIRYGTKYSSRISPTAHIVSRELYPKGNDYLVDAMKYARAENWEDAELAWLSGVKRETKRKKIAMLYHNLAMNEDRKGNITKAREYAKLAANQHPLGVKTQSVVGY